VVSGRAHPLLLIGLALSCHAPEPEDAPEPAHARRRDGGTDAGGGGRARATGRVEGIVRYEGELPPNLSVPMTGARAADCMAARGVYELSVVRGPEGGLANVFVSIEGIPAEERGDSPPAVTRTVVIDGCVVKPYVMDATVGDTLEVRNEDEHVYLCTLAGGPEAILKQGALPGQATSFGLSRAEGRRLDCTTDHPWLRGHVLVARHPYHAVTTASGRFVIENVPAGRHRVAAWHPTQRQASADVVVPEGGVGRAEIVFHARALPAPSPDAAAPGPDAGTRRATPVVPGQTRATKAPAATR
jgi:hypothetical protein